VKKPVDAKEDSSDDEETRKKLEMQNKGVTIEEF